MKSGARTPGQLSGPMLLLCLERFSIPITPGPDLASSSVGDQRFQVGGLSPVTRESTATSHLATSCHWQLCDLSKIRKRETECN